MSSSDDGEARIAYPEGLSAGCTDAELLEWLKQHYFTAPELAQAQDILATQGYEAAIAFLAQTGQDSIRCSEPAPRLYITIPGGKLIVYRPGAPAGAFDRVFCFGLGQFARLVLPLPPVGTPTASSHREPQSANGMLPLWASLDSAELPLPEAAQANAKPPPSKKEHSRPRKLHFDEQALRVGVLERQVNAWVVRERGLAYFMEPMRVGQGSIVNILHLRSGRTIASWSIPRDDELAHTRIRQLLAEVVQLTDWTQGIAALLKEKLGPHKLRQWERHIADIWSRQEREALFPLRDEDAVPLT